MDGEYCETRACYQRLVFPSKVLSSSKFFVCDRILYSFRLFRWSEGKSFLIEPTNLDDSILLRLFGLSLWLRFSLMCDVCILLPVSSLSFHPGGGIKLTLPQGCFCVPLQRDGESNSERADERSASQPGKECMVSKSAWDGNTERWSRGIEKRKKGIKDHRGRPSVNRNTRTGVQKNNAQYNSRIRKEKS